MVGDGKGQFSDEFVEMCLLGVDGVGDGIGRGWGYRWKSGLLGVRVAVYGGEALPFVVGLIASLLVGVDGYGE